MGTIQSGVNTLVNTATAATVALDKSEVMQNMAKETKEIAAGNVETAQHNQNKLIEEGKQINQEIEANNSELGKAKVNLALNTDKRTKGYKEANKQVGTLTQKAEELSTRDIANQAAQTEAMNIRTQREEFNKRLDHYQSNILGKLKAHRIANKEMKSDIKKMTQPTDGGNK